MEHMDSPDMATLLPRAQHGDQEAQMAIVTAFRPLLRKLASQEREYTLRMDLSSQLVLGTLEAIRKFPGTDSRRFPGFLKKHLTFLLSHYKRKQQRWRLLQEKVQLLEGADSCYTEDYADRDERQRVRKAFQALPRKEQRLLLQVLQKEKTWQQLAREEQVPLGTLYGRYRRILGALRRKLG